MRRICEDCLPTFITKNQGAWAPDGIGDVASFPCCIRATAGGGGAPCSKLASNGTLSVTRLEALVPSLAEPFAAVVRQATQERQRALQDAARFQHVLEADPRLADTLALVEETSGWKKALGEILTIRAEVPVCPGCGAPQCAPGDVEQFRSCCALFCSRETCPVFQNSNGFCFFCGVEVDCVRRPAQVPSPT